MDELYQNLVRLSPKEQVPFRCIGCGECCRHVHMQVPVETLDAFRIVKHLQQQGEDIECMDDFWERYTEPALLNECGFFVYFLCRCTGYQNIVNAVEKVMHENAEKVEEK